MRFYVAWHSMDPEYQKYDPECSLLVSPVAQPKAWTLGDFQVLPRAVMLDSGSYYLLRNPACRRSPVQVLSRQVEVLRDLWRHTEVSICHLDHPVLGTDRKRCYDAIEITIANAYELMHLFRSRPEYHALREHVNLLGVIQGIDRDSIQYCARELLRVGLFDRFGLGSLAPLMDRTEIISRVRHALGVVDNLHVFGVSSLSVMRQLEGIGVASFDSSRPMKAAIHCTLLYGEPLRCHTIAGTLKRPTITIKRPRSCSCPVCRNHRGELLKVGAKKYNNYRALHNYLALKRELCGTAHWLTETAP